MELAGATPFQFPPVDPNGQMDPPNTGGLFADLDGDGKPEVILTFYGSGGQGQSVAYRYENGMLVKTSLITEPGALVAVLDLDGDGRLDFVYSSEVDWGLGNGQFQKTELPGMVFNVGAMWDVDGNGLIDLVTAAWCGLPHVVLQMPGRTFTDGKDLVTGAGGIGSNALFAGNFGGRLVLGTIGFGCNDNQAEVPNFYTKQGSTFQAVDLSPGVSFSKGAAMGATTGADLDGDGQFDLLGQLSPQHVLISGDKLVKTSFYEVLSPTGKAMIPWTALLLDLDYDGHQDILFTHGADSIYGDRVAGIGPERVTAHWNGGGGNWGRFPSLGDADKLGDWRALGVGDLDGDGDPDLVVGGFGIDPRVYRNDTNGNGVGLRLLTKIGVPALGAVVKLTAGGHTQLLQVAGFGSAKEMSEPIIWAGLGTDTQGTLEITWTDGATQTETVPAGKTTTIRQKN